MPIPWRIGLDTVKTVVISAAVSARHRTDCFGPIALERLKFHLVHRTGLYR
jgi:hypothetical protein